MQEVNEDPGYDLVLSTEAHPTLVEVLCASLPARARTAAGRWSQAAPIVARYAPTLRDSGLLERDPDGHGRLMDEFRAAIAALQDA